MCKKIGLYVRRVNGNSVYIADFECSMIRWNNPPKDEATRRRVLHIDLLLVLKTPIYMHGSKSRDNNDLLKSKLST